MSKKIINIAVDSKCSWKFDWSEEHSWHSCVGEILKADKRDKGQVVRLNAAKPSKVETTGGGEKTFWHDQIKVNALLQKALDYVFKTYESKLYCGLGFQVVVYLNGQRPEVKGMPVDNVDRSWMDSPKKASSSSGTKADQSADEAAEDLLNS